MKTLRSMALIDVPTLAEAGVPNAVSLADIREQGLKVE